LTEKVFKALIASFEESAVYNYVHKNEAWAEQLENTRESLLKAFRKYYLEGYEQGRADEQFRR
jgi:hypothetical protein